MQYQTYTPHPDLKPFISCYWTLEVPASITTQKQRIIPDGCLEMAFILGEDIKRHTAHDSFIIQPRAMVLGQTIHPFYIEPTGHVLTFAVRFYPLGFANFVSTPIRSLSNKETPLSELFEKTQALALAKEIKEATSVKQRISIIERFLLEKLKQPATVDAIVTSTVDTLLNSKGNTSIQAILEKNDTNRRHLERKFAKQVGVSPKQLGKLIRLQTALSLLMAENREPLTQIAYESAYYDQAHFIKDFKEFTGVNPKAFLESENLTLSSIFYKNP